MQSNTGWEQFAKNLAGQLAEKGIQLKDITGYLATQTHACKHAGHFLACISNFTYCLPVMPLLHVLLAMPMCQSLGSNPTVHPQPPILTMLPSAKMPFYASAAPLPPCCPFCPSWTVALSLSYMHPASYPTLADTVHMGLLCSGSVGTIPTRQHVNLTSSVIADEREKKLAKQNMELVEELKKEAAMPRQRKTEHNEALRVRIIYVTWHEADKSWGCQACPLNQDHAAVLNIDPLSKCQ